MNSLSDLILDLMWRASEIFFAKRDKKASEESKRREEIAYGANRQAAALDSDEEREIRERELSDREKAARIVGNKTV